uniref:ZSWIM3 N-terminal domain-containing protein n=1 Tax=Onchocerca volvulus TaxID=6282 RepID=A0A8R1Y3M0_ONCVO
MASLKYTDETQKPFPTTVRQYAKKAGNAYIGNETIMEIKSQEMEEKRIDESKSSMQAESCAATAELQTIEQVRNGENKDGSAVEAAAKKALMKQTKNGMETTGNDNNTYKVNELHKMAIENGLRHKKRKPESVRRIIQCNTEQSGSEGDTKIAIQLYFDKINEEPIDLSKRNDLNNKNGQDQKLNKQSDLAISGEQNHGEMSCERNGEDIHRPGNASTNVKRKRCESKLLNLNQRYGNRTFSTFLPEEQEELRREASHICDGATFRSFAEFEKYFEAYKIVGNNPYRVASSEVLRDGEGRVIERFKYKYIVFHCAHYGSPRKRGGGKRPNQSYLPLGCKARFRLNADTTNGCLRISSFHKEHINHENSEEDYLRVVNKKRRNLIGGRGSKIMKMEKMDETEKAMHGCDNTEGIMPDVNKVVNTSETAENNPTTSVISSSENSVLIKSSHENTVPIKISSPGNSTLAISSQENSAFVPVTSSRSTEMTEQDDTTQQTLQQNMPSRDFFLQQILTVQFCHRLKRIEYLIMNAYIIKCGQYLPQEIYLSFIRGVYGADYHLSEWLDVQLKDVMIVLLKPPEILLQDELPADISIHEIKQIRIPQIQRAILAIREEKLKRCDKIIARFIRHIFHATSQPDFLTAVREFQKFADDVRNMDTSNIQSYGMNPMLQC